jgi:carbamoyl-phosphate synthase large subunit
MNAVADFSRWLDWTVAVTGMNARPDNPGPGCAVARCLRESPLFSGRLVGLGYDTLDPGLYMREDCDAGYLLPYPAAGTDALLERIDELLATEPFNAIIPCLDAELPNFIALEAALRQRGVFLMLPERAALRQRDKDRLPELCARAAVATPAVRRVTDPRFFRELDESQGWRYPLVVKGVFYDAYVVHSPEEAELRCRQLVAAWGYPVLAQQHVPGEEVNLTALGDGEGGLIGPVMMKKQAVTDKGKAWAGVAIDDPQLLAAGERLAATLRWRGPLEIEMLRDEAGVLQLIEINPRFPAWIYLSHGVGRNLPAAQLALMQGGRCAELELSPPRPGTTFIRHARETIVTLEEIVNVTINGASGHPAPRALAPL